MKTSTSANRFASLLGIFLIIAVWKIVSLFINAEIILPSPEVTVIVLLRVFVSPGFWLACLYTFGRVFAGFAAAVIIGTVCGIAAGRLPFFSGMLNPVLVVTRTTPVMAVILLAIIWFRTEQVPVFVAFLMTFPIICGNVIEGIQTIDPNLTAMADLFRLRRRDRIRHIYFPGMFPFLAAAARTALGLTWKVVIAAEVISLPRHGIGTGMQNAQMVIETAEVIAWAVVAVLLSGLSELAFRGLVRKVTEKAKHDVPG